MLEQVWSEDGAYSDPTAEVSGRESLVAHIGGFMQVFEGHAMELTSGVDEHHGWFRFSWQINGPDGSTAAEGFDVGQQDSSGRISQIVGFFGPFPDAS